MSQSLSALRSQMSGLLKLGQKPEENSTHGSAAAEVTTSDEAAAGVPVFSGPATDAQAEGMPEDAADATANSTVEETQPGCDKVQEKGTELKWQGMAKRLGTEAKWGEMVGKMHTAETDASATSSSSGAPSADHEQAFANATAFDRAQVAFSMFSSAVRSRVSALRTPEV